MSEIDALRADLVAAHREIAYVCKRLCVRIREKGEIRAALTESRAQVERLNNDLAWIKAAVMTNADVHEECAREIARAVGWTYDEPAPEEDWEKPLKKQDLNYYRWDEETPR